MTTVYVPCYLENEEGYEYSVIAEVVIEPAQNGGMTDPSWAASWDVYALRNAASVDVIEELSVDDAESINQQVISYFEDEARDRD